MTPRKTQRRAAVKPVKPVKAWALVTNDQIVFVLEPNAERDAIEEVGLDHGERLIRVEVRPVTRRKGK